MLGGLGLDVVRNHLKERIGQRQDRYADRAGIALDIGRLRLCRRVVTQLRILVRVRFRV